MREAGTGTDPFLCGPSRIEGQPLVVTLATICAGVILCLLDLVIGGRRRSRWTIDGPVHRLVRDHVRVWDYVPGSEVQMTAIPISKARERLFPLVREINDDHSIVEIVGKDGNAILMSAADYASWQETLYLLSTPANAAHLVASIAQAHAGDVVKVDLDDVRAQIDGETAG